jgi:Na+-transporting NADH:ubiquinone oxidoreductase subunit D
MAFKDTVGGKALIANIWNENPVFRQMLGICSTLAVTNLLKNTLLMCGGLVFTAALSSLTVSVLRAHIPKQVRMMVQVLIIAAYVIIVDTFIRAQFPDIHKTIGPYVGLIITNCIIMGRAEAFATKNKAWPSLLDGVGAGLGYSLVLVIIAVFREALGFGTLMGYELPGKEIWWYQWTIMVMPPGAFFMLALMAWFGNAVVLKKENAGGAK